MGLCSFGMGFRRPDGPENAHRIQDKRQAGVSDPGISRRAVMNASGSRATLGVGIGLPANFVPQMRGSAAAAHRTEPVTYSLTAYGKGRCAAFEPSFGTSSASMIKGLWQDSERIEFPPAMVWKASPTQIIAAANMVPRFSS